jgi:hypothetical protein
MWGIRQPDRKTQMKNIALQQKKLLGFKTLAPLTNTEPGFKSGKPLTESTIRAKIGGAKIGGKIGVTKFGPRIGTLGK